jgi:hypothetical protein
MHGHFRRVIGIGHAHRTLTRSVVVEQGLMYEPAEGPLGVSIARRGCYMVYKLTCSSARLNTYHLEGIYVRWVSHQEDQDGITLLYSVNSGRQGVGILR